MTTNESVLCKAQMLSQGIAIDKSVIDNYDNRYIEKRRAYGIQDPTEYMNLRIPQELVIQPDNIVCSININPSSSWILKYDVLTKSYFVTNGEINKAVTFPIRPLFYDKILDNKTRVNQIISLYGGHSIGAFLIRNCFFENHGVCHFCSLCNNHGSDNDFSDIIMEEDLLESIDIALQEDYPITQIMLNGGNLECMDSNFNFYVDRLLSVRKLLDDKKRNDVELHLIVSPPKDLNLLRRLVDANVKIAMNTEAYDDSLFKRYCPGKNAYIGRDHIFESLKTAVDFLGFGNVYSIFVGGLESVESLKIGMTKLAEFGIIPVINVLHIDPNTYMDNSQRPSVDFILEAGKILQNIYGQFSEPFVPFYKECGRNSLDSEAHSKLF